MRKANLLIASMFTAGLLLTLSARATADGHETVEALKAQLAGMEKKMAAVTKDRDSLYDQLLSTIEELETAEANAGSAAAAVQNKLDQVTAGRDYLASRLEQSMADSKAMQADAAAELQSSEQSNEYLTNRLDELFNAQKASNAANAEQIAALEAESTNLAEVAFQQIESAIGERNALQEQLDAANKANAKMASDMESVINGRSYIEKLLAQAKADAAAEKEAMQASNAGLQTKLDQVTAGRDHLASKLEETMAESKSMQADAADELQSAESSNEFLTNRVDELFQSHKTAMAALQTENAALLSELDEIKNSPANWAKGLDEYLSASYSGLDGVSVSKLSDNTVNIRVGNSGLFKVASTELSTVGKDLMTQIGDALATREDSQILVVGHTDNIPVGKNSRFADNEDLSNQRALEAMNQLGNSGISFDRMSSTGVADSSPIADNSTAEGRAQNRRVEIVLTPRN